MENVSRCLFFIPCVWHCCGFVLFLYQNDVSEEEQRWGSKTVEGSVGRAGAVRYELCIAVVTRAWVCFV